MKEQYINLMEKVFCAYSAAQIDAYLQKTRKEGLSEHGFPRLTANLGILLSHGRKQNLKDSFLEMMNLCCSEMPTAFEKKGWMVGNDFSVKEIVFCLMEIEQAKLFDPSVTQKWRSDLKKIVPEKTYSVISPFPPERVNNWAAFGAASEQVRKYAGIGREDAFVENQIQSQLLSFDSNGMYRDPHEPMVYDVVARLQLAVALHFGYEGEGRKKLLEQLLQASEITLKMQSISGEIPFGGRSNQFLHNEACFAALCEFYAVLWKRYNDEEKAVMFRSSAQRAIENLKQWLDNDPIHHVKNYYDLDSQYGCECYAYFDKYMITTASWLYLAYVFSDDSISSDRDLECENYICETTPHFHKLFCKFNEYFLEIDTNADTNYDSSGLGRIHRLGAPSALCISVPFTKTPSYGIDIENPSNYSISGGIKTECGFCYGFDEGIVCKMTEQSLTKDAARIKLEYRKENQFLFYQSVSVSEGGVEIILEGKGGLEITFPVFAFDGRRHTEISVSEEKIEVQYQNYVCSFSTNVGKIEDKKQMLANRNGHYRAFSVSGRDLIVLKIKID